MSHRHRLQGFGRNEALLALIVIVVAAAILTPLFNRVRGTNLLLTESGRMRNVYRALYFYEEQYDSHPAPSLVAVSRYDPNRLDFLSSRDPFAGASGSAYPSDPGLPNGESSTFRISFSYIQNFLRAKKLTLRPWSELRMDPKIGELADEWYGDINPGSNFQAQVSGRLLRVNTDGSVWVVHDRGGPKPLGDPQDLFIKR